MLNCHILKKDSHMKMLHLTDPSTMTSVLCILCCCLYCVNCLCKVFLTGISLLEEGVCWICIFIK